MVVYIEYALLENFLIDGMLLYLALRAARQTVRVKRLLLAAALGSAFAVAFPLVSLPTAAEYAVKLAFAPVLCAVAFGRVRKRGKAFALFLALFFAFSSAFAGALFALLPALAISSDSYEIARAPATATLCGGAAFAIAAIDLVKKLYKKRATERFVYDCEIVCGTKSAKVRGFLDSGNTATKNGAPVCFVSPELVFSLWGEDAWQGYEELRITTVSGEKTARLYKGVLRTENGEREAYFSPAANMISREYKLLLHARIFERRETE